MKSATYQIFKDRTGQKWIADSKSVPHPKTGGIRLSERGFFQRLPDWLEDAVGRNIGLRPRKLKISWG